MKKKLLLISIMFTLIMISMYGCKNTPNTDNVPEEITDEPETILEEIEEDVSSEPEVVFSDFSDVVQYKTATIAELEQIFSQNNIGYTLASNEDILLGNESSYVLLDHQYGITEIAYSLYYPTLNTVDTVFSFKYEIHPEKGMDAESKHSKWLYDMLNYFGCNTFSSVEDMVEQLNESNSVLVESDSVYVEASTYTCSASAIIRKECNFSTPEFKYMNFDSLDERTNYMETLESTVEERFSQYQSEGGNVVDSNGNPLIRFRCMDANDEAGMDNDLGIMVSFLEINGQQEYTKDCIELIKIICDYIGIENMTNMGITSADIAEQLMTYVELENYFSDKDEPFFSWQQEGGWDKLFVPVEHFHSNPFGVQYQNARYYEWNKGDNVYEGIYIPATVQEIKNYR